ncbi:MAG: nitronate monooxygenase [Cytophagales bacterium]|nr:MAG: nitronate monooxygenase [Cytophagales bacterium]TAF61519.1 MAG: nitronate monooxygenase [Cytophagales bacterium]
MKNIFCETFGVQIPIIQAGMVWCSGWKLASAVSEAGGLGVLGAGSMNIETLQYHIKKCQARTLKPFAVNLPLLYPHTEAHVASIIAARVPVVITSAGNPSTYTSALKSAGCRVMHVVSSTKFALKAQQAGVDAVIGEGFEAGGHNGREETTTLCLIPELVKQLTVPIVAAGGIACGRSMLAAVGMGACAVQVGSRFATAEESSAHRQFKEAVIKAQEGDTDLIIKAITPTRMLKNSLYQRLKNAENQGADRQTLSELLGRGRSKLGIFEGNLDEGELEIGQVAASIKQIQSAKVILEDIWQDFLAHKANLLKNWI